MEEGYGRPHAVVFPFPVQGHIIPMMNLSCRLESLGFHITFVNTDRNHVRILRSWRQKRMALPLDQNIHVNMVGIPDDAMPPFSTVSVHEAILVTDKLRSSFESLMNKLVQNRENPPVCIIADGFMAWTRDVAQKFSLSWAVFWASSAATSLISTYIPNLMHRGFAPLSVGNEKAQVSFIPGLPTLSASDLPTSLSKEDRYDPGFRHRIDRIEQIRQADWVLVNSLEELELNEVGAMQDQVANKYLTIGPMLPSEFLGVNDGTVDIEITTEETWDDYSCLDWLDRQAALSVVLISFGNTPCLSPRQLEQISLGLRNSGVPFLWLVQSSFVQGLPENIRISFMECVRERGRLVSSVPLRRVLGHKAIGAFLSHCGWNSTLEGITGGIPILCLPCFADQMLNSRYIAREWKVGLSFEKSGNGLVGKEEVESVIRSLMQGHEGRQVRRRMQQLKEVTMNAVREGGSSRRNLKAFARAMKATMTSSMFF